MEPPTLIISHHDCTYLKGKKNRMRRVRPSLPRALHFLFRHMSSTLTKGTAIYFRSMKLLPSATTSRKVTSLTSSQTFGRHRPVCLPKFTRNPVQRRFQTDENLHCPKLLVRVQCSVTRGFSCECEPIWVVLPKYYGPEASALCHAKLYVINSDHLQMSRMSQVCQWQTALDTLTVVIMMWNQGLHSTVQSINHLFPPLSARAKVHRIEALINVLRPNRWTHGNLLRMVSSGSQLGR
jgi:hypothetical protein